MKLGQSGSNLSHDLMPGSRETAHREDGLDVSSRWEVESISVRCAGRNVHAERWTHAVGGIIATIITHHMTEIANAYVGLHAGSIAIICPPPMSIISISMPPPSNR